MPNRTRATLEELIIRHAHHLRMLRWLGCVRHINEMGISYRYSVVQLVANFVDPEDQMEHTNCIEGLWSHAKKKLKQLQGTIRNLFRSHLEEEFLWYAFDKFR